MTEPRIIEIGNLVKNSNWVSPQRGKIFSPFGLAPCMYGLGGGGNLEPKILVRYDKGSNTETAED